MQADPVCVFGIIAALVQASILGILAGICILVSCCSLPLDLSVEAKLILSSFPEHNWFCEFQSLIFEK